MTTSKTALATVVAGCILAGAVLVAAKPTPEQKCQAAKLKLAAKKASCELLGVAKGAPDFPTCSAAFAAAFNKLKTTCDGDEASLETLVDDFRSSVLGTLTPASDKCVAGKIKATGKKQACELAVDARAILKGGSPDVTICQAKFAGAFARLEKSKRGCATHGDIDTVERDVDAFASQAFGAVTGEASTTTTSSTSTLPASTSTSSTLPASTSTTSTAPPPTTTTTTTVATSTTSSTVAATTTTTSTVPGATTTTTTTLAGTTTTSTTIPALAVVRAGDGTQNLGAADTAVSVFIDRFTTTGASAGTTVALPTALNGGGTGNQPFAGASDQTEGMLSRSVDGHFVVLSGYAAAPGTTPVSASASATIQRVVARVDAAGAVDTTTLLGTTAYTGNNVRSAASVDGTAFWVGGAGNPNGGVWYATRGGGTVTQIETSPGPTSLRSVEIFGSQLFASGNNNNFKRVLTIGSGLPTTGGQTATALSGMTDASPFSYLLLDRDAGVAGLDTLYVADNSAFPVGGIQKWTFDGATWTLAKTFESGLSNGVRGLAGFESGGNVVLAATTNETTANNLVVLVDDGSPSPTATTIAVAPTGTQFRGVALAPE